jgi:hypothetical protein
LIAKILRLARSTLFFAIDQDVSDEYRAEDYHSMTSRQREKLKLKIKKIKSELAADKRRWGGFYDDSRGLRYLPPALYIKLEDYTGALRYFNWFAKNFPDDIGFPEFIFEWTFVLYQRGRTKEAEKKAFDCFCSNTYLLDHFLGNRVTPIDKDELSNLDRPEYLQHFNYSVRQKAFADFGEWLAEITWTEKFLQAAESYVGI